MRDKFRAVESELNATYLERREVVRGLLVGLLARQHVLLIGPPGTAKSALAEDLCSRIGGRYFRWLLARTSTPEELFGPVSLKALEQDSYRRVVSGKLPEASVAFLDEIFKCNSAVLNTLLPTLNERLFFNDGTPMQVPLEMAVGASNELPEDREELAALWDRFMLRYVVGYLRDKRAFERMLTGGKAPQTRTTIEPRDLAAAQAEVRSVDVSRIIPQVATLRGKATELHVPVSDRRWKAALELLRANTWLEGRDKATDDDLEILAPAMWQEPGQIVQVRQAIMAMANPLDQEALTLADEASEVYQIAMAAGDEEASAKGAEANAKLKRIAQRLDSLHEEATNKGRDTGRIMDTLRQVTAWNKEVVAKCLGVAI